MNTVDLTVPTRKFVVSTQKLDSNHVARMGPEVKINAHNSADAIKRVEQAGYTPNDYFPPKEIHERNNNF